MDKVLGEAIRMEEVAVGDLLWHNRGWLMVVHIDRREGEMDGITRFDFMGGAQMYVLDGEHVMRAGRFLVGRRLF